MADAPPAALQSTVMRRWWYPAVLLLIVAVPTDAASSEPPLRAVPIVDAGGHSLDRFAAALDRTIRGERGAITRIAVFGDSHVASGLFTGALRRRLQARYGDAGHGFVLLGSAWDLYRPLDVARGSTAAWRTRRIRPRDRGPVRVGLGGAVSRTTVAGAVTWAATVPGHPLSRIDLLYERAPGEGRLAVRIDGRMVATLGGEAQAPTSAWHTTEVGDGQHRIEVEALGPGPSTVFGAIFERSGPGVVVDDLGVPALAAPHLLAHDVGLLREHLSRRRPDLVVHAFGTNDVRWEGIDLDRYRAVVSESLARLRQAAPESSCLVLGPIDRRLWTSDGAWPATLEQVIERQRQAAADAGCAFWDQRAAMGGAGSMARWMASWPRWTLRDGVHLSGRGYDTLAAALIEALSAHRAR
jgi:lysophospholipase L1-like esterase